MRTTGALTDASGTSGNGSATDILAQATARSIVLLGNPSAVDMWFSWTVTAAANAAGCFKLAAGTDREWRHPNFVPTNKLSLYCASAQPYTLNHA